MKLFDITWDFDLAERCGNALKTRYKLHLEYNCTILLNRNTNMILNADLHNMLTATMLGSPIAGKEYMG